MSDQKHILFVDDEPKILRGMRRQLNSMADKWYMAFAESGIDALDILGQSDTPYDVIVTDIRMPGIDGIELLKQVQKKFPHMVRIVLTGQVDRDSVIRAVGLAHQFLVKPCTAKTLQVTLSHAFSLRKLLNSNRLKKLVSQLKTLPSLPTLYKNLLSEIQKSDASVKKIGEIIAQDMSMTAKILQLVNSVFFGLRRHISNPTQAVMLLGLDTVKALVLSVHVFSQFNGVQLKKISLEQLQMHRLTVGAFAKRIAEAEGRDKQVADFAFTAGLLHDIGRLVLATNLPEEYVEALSLEETMKIDLLRAEQMVFEATHAEVGAYLLGIWGLPDEVVEALAFHHNPFENISKDFCALTAVHVANCLAHESRLLASPGNPPQINEPYLEQLGYRDRISEWRALCLEIA